MPFCQKSCIIIILQRKKVLNNGSPLILLVILLTPVTLAQGLLCLPCTASVLVCQRQGPMPSTSGDL